VLVGAIALVLLIVPAVGGAGAVVPHTRAHLGLNPRHLSHDLSSFDKWSGPAGTGAWVSLQSTLTAFYQKINKDAPNARIFVMGYPNPLPPQPPAGGCPGLNVISYDSVRDADWTFLYNLVNTLNNTISLAVQATGLAVSTLEYVPPNSGFVNANACSPTSAFISFNQYIATGGKLAMLHPNQAGQALMAASLVAAVNQQTLP